MKRALKIAGLVLVALVVLAPIGMRMSRGGFKPPIEVKPGFMSIDAGGVEVYAARAGSKVILFDASMDEQGRAVDALLASMKATRADVSDVFVTHGHPDHIAAVPL